MFWVEVCGNAFNYFCNDQGAPQPCLVPPAGTASRCPCHPVRAGVSSLPAWASSVPLHLKPARRAQGWVSDTARLSFRGLSLFLRPRLGAKIWSVAKARRGRKGIVWGVSGGITRFSSTGSLATSYRVISWCSLFCKYRPPPPFCGSVPVRRGLTDEWDECSTTGILIRTAVGMDWLFSERMNEFADHSRKCGCHCANIP